MIKNAIVKREIVKFALRSVSDTLPDNELKQIIGGYYGGVCIPHMYDETTCEGPCYIAGLPGECKYQMYNTGCICLAN